MVRHVVDNLVGEAPKFLGERMGGANLDIFPAFIDAGLCGRKTGKGFLDYSDPKAKDKPIHADAKKIIADFKHPTKSVAGVPVPELVDRLVLRFVSEAVHCLQSGVVGSAREGDIGAVFGIGFPPFLGGPFMYIDRVGAQTIVDKMEALRKEHGEQFAPPELLVEHAKAGKLFHA